MGEHPLSLNHLWGKIGDVKIGMFTTVDAAGQLKSQPMTSQEIDVDGVLWFFTSLQFAIARDLALHPTANISFAEPHAGFYASLAGHASLVIDRSLYANLWNPLVKAWFPRGLDDPDLTLIRFEIESAEYWDSASSKMVQLLHIMKAAVTGTTPTSSASHGRIQMDR